MHGDLSPETFKVRIGSDETNKRACYGKEEKGMDRISWDLSCWAHNAKLRLIMIDLKNLNTKKTGSHFNHFPNIFSMME